jgi:cell division septation protein DedD
MGFKVGRDSVKGTDGSLTVTGAASSTSQSSKAKPPASSDLSFYKAVQQNSPDPQLATPANATPSTGTPSSSPSSSSPSASAAPSSAAGPADSSAAEQLSNTNGYLVQVAAVTKQEDADALVDALKKKQYPAFSTSNAVDKLVHVQVGPFSDIKQAEDTRAKLMNDGYNPILKK